MRISFFKLLLLLGFLAIIMRLAYWQIIKKDDLTVKAEDQHFQQVEVNATRGNIYFSDGNILAGSKPIYQLYGQPKVLTDEQKLAIATRVALLMPEADQDQTKQNILNQLSKNLFWVPLLNKIDINTKKKIDSLNLPGAGFNASSERFYPEGSSSAHLLGFVGGSDIGGAKTGYFGVEGYYNGELKGITGQLTEEHDSAGLPILGGLLGNNAKNGDDLVLNIDRSVQYIVEQRLKEGLEKYGAKSASAVIMDPKTGAVLALAAYPNYDPASYTDFPKNDFRDAVVADQYEPGSTFKVLVMAAAINEGVVKPDTICDTCSGSVQIDGFDIRTWDNKYFPNTTMTDVIIHSDNTGMVFVSQKLGLDKMYSYIQNYGFGSLTNIDLQDEASPDLRPKSNWRQIDLATSSFGQGIAVTPIQMVRAVSAIANGGYLMEPHVVKEIKDGTNTFIIQPKVVRTVISPETSKVMTDIMVQAVDKGEAQWYKYHGGVGNFKIAGKTGTAQIPVAGHYDPNKTIASFVGFAPADDPKFVMLIRFDQPSASIFGADTAAPTFFEIAKQLFNYYRIAPTE